MTVQIYNTKYEGIQSKAEEVIAHLRGLLRKGYAISTATSMGKDSSCVLVLFLEALRRAKQEGESLPQCFVSHSNTLIENPAMDSYTGEMIVSLEKYIEKEDLPVQVVLAEPSITSSFF